MTNNLQRYLHVAQHQIIDFRQTFRDTAVSANKRNQTPEDIRALLLIVFYRKGVRTKFHTHSSHVNGMFFMPVCNVQFQYSIYIVRVYVIVWTDTTSASGSVFESQYESYFVQSQYSVLQTCLYISVSCSSRIPIRRLATRGRRSVLVGYFSSFGQFGKGVHLWKSRGGKNNLNT